MWVFRSPTRIPRCTGVLGTTPPFKQSTNLQVRELDTGSHCLKVCFCGRLLFIPGFTSCSPNFPLTLQSTPTMALLVIISVVCTANRVLANPNGRHNLRSRDEIDYVSLSRSTLAVTSHTSFISGDWAPDWLSGACTLSPSQYGENST